MFSIFSIYLTADLYNAYVSSEAIKPLKTFVFLTDFEQHIENSTLSVFVT